MTKEMTVTAKFDATLDMLEKAFVTGEWDVEGFDYNDMMDFLRDRREKSARKGSTRRKVDPAKEEFYALVENTLHYSGEPMTAKEVTAELVHAGEDVTAAKVRGALTVLVKRESVRKVVDKAPAKYVA